MCCERVRPRHRIPQRTCIACRKVAPKRELLRLTIGSEGKVVVDTEQTKPGRGAYLCASSACWNIGLKGDRLGRFLRGKVSSDEREELRVLGDSLLSNRLAARCETE